MANIVFLESGTSASQDTKFYSSTSANVPTSVTTPTFSGPRSLSCDSTAGNTTAFVLRTSALADAGRRISVYVRFSALPTTNANFIACTDSGNTTTIWRLQLQTNGKLRFVGTGNGTSGNTVLVANNWYRIAIGYTVTDTTHNHFKCWVQDVTAGAAIPGSAELDETNLTLAVAGTSRLELGWFTAPGASIIAYYQHVYVDDGTDLADPAAGGSASTSPLLVTNKFANSGAVYASNANYTTRGTGAINEQPPSTTNGQNITSNSATGEYSTAIQTASQGDADISTYNYIGSMGWLYASGVSTDQIVLLNSPQAPTVAIGSTAAVVFAPNTSSSYPQDASNRTIGIKRPTGATTDSIYGDGGVLVAYTIPSVLDLTQSFSDDANNLADALAKAAGIPKSFADDANNLADAMTFAYGYAEFPADSLQALTDALVKVLSYELAFADSEAANWADAHQLLLAQYLALTDALQALSDTATLRLEQRVEFTDTLNSLSDEVASQLGTTLELTDSITVLTDSYTHTLGYSIVSSDSLVITDSLGIGYGLLAGDAIALTDLATVVMELRLSFTESIDNLADSATVQLAQLLEVTDLLQLPTDSLAIGYGLLFTDTLTLADALTIDIQDTVVGTTEHLTDNVDLLTDELALGYGLLITDTATALTDSLTVSMGQRIAVDDVLALSESLALGYGLLVNDDTNTLIDTIQISAPQGPNIQVGVTDALVGLTDELALQLGYQLALADDADTLSDSITTIEGLLSALSDSFALSDSLATTFGHLQPLADSLTLLSDSLQLRLGYEVPASDTITLTDASTRALGYQVQLSDNVANWADSLALTPGFALIISDNTQPLADAIELVASSRLQLADTLALSDSLAKFSAGYLPLEDVLVLADEIATELRGPDFDFALADTLTLTDSIAIVLASELRLQLVVTDTITLTDHYFDLRYPYPLSTKRHVVVSSAPRVTTVTGTRVIKVPATTRTTKVD